MPIYEYKCENGHVFDVMQRISDGPLTECVECGAPVKKVLQPVNISFKGSGFYSTDYKSEGVKAETSDKAASKNGESSTNGASDSAGGAEKKSEKTPTEPTKKGD